MAKKAGFKLTGTFRKGCVYAVVVGAGMTRNVVSCHKKEIAAIKAARKIKAPATVAVVNRREGTLVEFREYIIGPL